MMQKDFGLGCGALVILLLEHWCFLRLLLAPRWGLYRCLGAAAILFLLYRFIDVAPLVLVACMVSLWNWSWFSFEKKCRMFYMQGTMTAPVSKQDYFSCTARIWIPLYLVLFGGMGFASWVCKGFGVNFSVIGQL